MPNFKNCPLNDPDKKDHLQNKKYQSRKSYECSDYGLFWQKKELSRVGHLNFILKITSEKWGDVQFFLILGEFIYIDPNCKIFDVNSLVTMKINV